MKKNKFVIIDAMALAYRGYYAFINRPLTTSHGEPTSAVFGFINQLIKVLEDQKPDYIAVAFDSKEKTFRHEKYEAYKSSRQAMPEDMIPQIQKIKDIVQALNIPLYIFPGYEADDIIGSAVRIAEKKGFTSYAVTPDKDYFQLISDKVFIIRPGKKSDEAILYDTQKVIDELGFEPKYMIDYLAIVGDSSDDIPGVKGIGPKGAVPLIQKFGTLEKIYQHINEIDKAGIKSKLESGKDSALLSKELATIYCEVPIDFNFDDSRFSVPDFEKLKQLLFDLEFKTIYTKLMKLYDNSSSHSLSDTEVPLTNDGRLSVFDKSSVKYTLIIKEHDARKLAAKLLESDLFVFDTETDNLNTFEVNIAGVAFCIHPAEAYFVAINPFEEEENLFTKQISDRLHLSTFRKIFKKVFENPEIKKVCQNGKYDISVLRSIEIYVNNFFFDTMLASYIIDPDQKHGMDDLAEKYLNYSPISLSTIIGEKKEPSKIFDAELEALKDYSAEDADVTFRLFQILDKEMKKEGIEKVAYEIEFPLAPVLEAMEYEGVKIDTNALKLFSKDLQILLDNYTSEIYKSAGTEFNINSPKQLQEILFDKLNLSTGRKTKTGFSTDARALENLRGEHEIIDFILSYRQVTKLKSTYTDALPNLINPKTGRIHTSYNQTVASTGRLSSIDPNLQNIPIRTEMGKEIRKAFIPRNDDYLILSADYSQIELR
ncbi:MAG: DNA polymerase I, partial [Ignavibacteriaceae bacterium]|nr:DNA polymerase I [Ignavibacteriaceae bacterium]